MTSNRLIAAAIGLMMPLVIAASASTAHASAASNHRHGGSAHVTTATYDVPPHHASAQTVDYRRHYHPRHRRHYSHRRYHHR